MIKHLSFLMLLLLVQIYSPVITVSAQDKPPPDMPPIPDRLSPPPMPERPTQADYGAQVYHLVCMVCHGDRGQGLTDEWRGVLDPEDQNCWQSRCHAKNHPPEGFVFPTYVPPVMGDVMRVRFKTALDLHDYLQTRMPWQAPGMRSEEEYWQLTAYLLRLNGFDLGDQELDASRAAKVFLSPLPLQDPTPTSTSPPTPVSFGISDPGWLILVGLIISASLLVVLLVRNHRVRRFMNQNEDKDV